MIGMIQYTPRNDQDYIDDDYIDDDVMMISMLCSIVSVVLNKDL